MNNPTSMIRNACSVGLRTPSAHTTRALDGYLFEHRDIPTEIASYAKAKLGPSVSVHPPRRNASYKGPVLLNTPDWLIQAIGSNGSTAIVHRKVDVTLIGSLQTRDKAKRLIGASAQVHYNGGQAKVYPLSMEKLHAATRQEASRRTPGIER
jgi:hypothetical protein